MKVAEFMTKDPCCIQVDETLRQGHRLMRARRIRHLPVLDGQRLAGVVSERDLLLLETLRRVDPGTEPVSQAMTDDPFCVPPGADLLPVIVEMRRRGYGSAVVVEGGVAGIFTRSDALRALEQLLR